MFIHQGDSVDESYHVENMDIRSDLFCGLGAEQEDFSRLVHSFVRGIDSRSRNVLGSHDGCSHAPPSSREVHLETKPANQGVERDRSACEFFSVRPQFIGLIQEHGFKEILTLSEDLKMPSIDWPAQLFRSTRRSEYRDAVKEAEKATAKYPRMGRAWFNLDLLWAAALIGAGILTLLL